MLCAILKYSHRKISRDGFDIEGGVAGTAFFLTSGIGLSVFHVCRDALFEPNPG
jgi:hypothetical protein